MNPTAKTVLVSVVTAVAAVAAYHATLGKKDAAPETPVVGDPGKAGPSSASIAALRREMEDLRAAVAVRTAPGTAVPPAEAAGLLARFDALASRVEALEGRSKPATDDPGHRPSDAPVGAGDRPSTWTAEQLAALESMMAEIQARKARERETASWSKIVKENAPKASPGEQTAATNLLVEFLRKIRLLFEDGSAGTTPEERQAKFEKAQALRTKTIEDLRAVLSPDAVDKLAPHVPDFSDRLGRIPPTAPDPASLPSMSEGR